MNTFKQCNKKLTVGMPPFDKLKSAVLTSNDIDLKKELREQERHPKKHKRNPQKEAQAAFKAKWTKKAIKEARKRWQQLVKNPPSRICFNYQAPFCDVLPPQCKRNMAL